MTGAEWKAKFGEKLLAEGWTPQLLDKCAASLDQLDAHYQNVKLFWDTATYEQKEHVLLQDLAAAKCHVESPKHNPNACNSCGPIHVALRMLKEGKL